MYAENDMPDNRSLLSALKKLYSQLSQISWGITQVRINSYKRDAKVPSNITHVLQKQIEQLSSQSSSKNVEVSEAAAEQNIENNEISKKSSKDAKVENMTGIESEFAKHVKQRHPPTITQPQIGENLKSSVWEHINAAIRSAKSGDVETAKLHTNIAGSALEEAGHYMSHDDYSELVLQIEKYFSEHSQ